MNESVKQKIFDTILAYDKIVLSRHIRPDGDALGAAFGLKSLLQESFPEKKILAVGEDSSDLLAFLGENDAQPSDDFYRDALLIVLDAGTADRISNAKYPLARQIIRIDHHASELPYGDLAWVEPERSSVCEMITDFFVTFRDRLVMTRPAALALYTGIVTDSGRFRFPSVTGETLRLAALLLDQDLDTQALFSQLYLDDFSHFKYEAYVYDHLEISENGVAYLFVTREMQELFGLDREAAGHTVDYLDSIRGSLIWIAFIETPEEIRVRLRSRFATVRELALRYRGGGHAMASGATVYSFEEARQLVAEADAWLGEYKRSHEGWL